MESAQRKDKFEEFFREEMEDELARAEAEGRLAAVIDFAELQKFSPRLAEDVLEYPVSTLDDAAQILNDMSMLESELTPRFENLPDGEFVGIRNLRSHHIGEMLGIKGIIKRASEVRPEIVSATWECDNCGDLFTIEQESAELKKPHRCDCGSRNFELADKELEDVQVINVEEDPEALDGPEQPRNIGVYLRGDLVDPDFQNRVIPGNKVIITGVLREKEQANNKDSKRYDLFLEGNYLEPTQTEFEEIEITPEDEQEILELSQDDDIYDKIVDSIAPSIHGHRQVKQAIALQLFAGVRKERPDGTSTRGDMHMLLIGEPGTGKSQILKFTGNLAPKGKYVVGKAATAAGITATVVKDEVTEEWTLEAGALVLANKGLATVDEIDKMSNEDRSSMHEAMEQQSITISKANIQATLQCQTSILAAGNPKHGRFDPYEPVGDQIDISDTLLSRFDLIFPVKDEPNKQKDRKLTKHILSMHTDPQQHRGEIEKEELQRYIAYAKRNVRPELTEEAEQELEDFYVETRAQGASGDGLSKVPITARQLEALIRLSEASAKTRLSETVEQQDAQRAIDLLTYSLKEIGVIDDSGDWDVDKLETGMSTESRNNIQEIKHIVRNLGGDGNPVPVQDVLAEAEEQGIPEDTAEEVIEDLKREGELYEPQSGHIGEI